MSTHYFLLNLYLFELFTPDPVQSNGSRSLPTGVFIGTINVGNGTVECRRKKNTLAATEQGKLEDAFWKLQFHPARWFRRKGHVSMPAYHLGISNIQ